MEREMRTTGGGAGWHGTTSPNARREQEEPVAAHPLNAKRERRVEAMAGKAPPIERDTRLSWGSRHPIERETRKMDGGGGWYRAPPLNARRE